MFSIFKRLLGIRSHHMVGAGALASAIGLYSLAARVGLAPSDLSSAVQWIRGPGAPLVAEAESRLGAAIPAIANAANATGFTMPTAGGYPAPANAAYPPAGYGMPNYGAGDIACYFSPKGGCTEAVVAEIHQARQQIFVQAYSFTSAPIANALVEMHNRGVQVYIVLDKSQKTEQYSGADFVANAGIPTLIDSAHAIAHNKIMLIDGRTIITGSFNFTKNAEENNAENLLIIRGRPDLYQAYETNFRHHYEHSQPHQGRGVSGGPANRNFGASNFGTSNFGTSSASRILASPQ